MDRRAGGENAPGRCGDQGRILRLDGDALLRSEIDRVCEAMDWLDRGRGDRR